MTNISSCVQLRTIQLMSEAPLARGVLTQHSRVSNAYTSVSLDAFANAAVRMLRIPSVMHTLTRHQGNVLHSRFSINSLPHTRIYALT